MNVKKILSDLWQAEPVLINVVPPLLVSAGFLSADAADALADNVSYAVAGAAMVWAAVGAIIARRKVTPTKSPASNDTAPLPTIPES